MKVFSYVKKKKQCFLCFFSSLSRSLTALATPFSLAAVLKNEK